LPHEGLNFKQTILAGAASTLLATVVIWLFGYLPSVWSWLIATAVTLWKLVSYPISMPIGMLFLIVPFCFLVNRKSTSIAPVQTTQPRATTRIEPAAIKSTPLVVVPQQLQLTNNETRVVQMLAAADGRWMSLFEISRQLNLSNLMTEQALESLLGKCLIADSHSYIDGTSFRLSSQGRDYAITNGYVT
jgi:hypothetical protein